MQTDIVDESNAFDVDMFPVKSVLKEFHDVLSHGVLGGETFGPGKENTRIEGRLLNREGESHR